MKITEDEILSYIQVELSNSTGGVSGDSIESNRRAALATYLGQPNGKEVEGRSHVISTDVADAIEWIMPDIVKAFTQNNEVVTFDPVGNGDELQAELESQYVYDILMKDNPGFIILHTFIKDALLQKNGFIKVYYEDCSHAVKESYTGLTEIELNLVLSSPDVKLLEKTEYLLDSIPFFDVKVARQYADKKIKVVSVPPEEFRVCAFHNSVDLSNARFTAHVLTVTAGDLVKQGYDKAFVDDLPTAESSAGDLTGRQYRFYMQDESDYSTESSIDPSLREIEIAECYMKMDIDNTGIARMVKVTAAGGDEPTAIIDVEEIDENPFISTTAILMSHKLFGLSLYDRLKQIQEQKTTLWRNILDNMYLQNNQRTVVLDGQVNLDDLMVSRPGGIIRAKNVNAVIPYPTTPLSSDAYKMMDYLDQVRAGRSGAYPEGPVTENMIGERVGSQGIEKMLTKKEELVGLMIRVIAETGIKPLCYMIRNAVRRHQDVAREYMFRGNWVKVNPTKWKERSHSTVRVGTGSGNRQQQLAAVTQIMMVQEKILASPSQSLVTEHQVYAAANDFAKFSGLPGVSKYLLDPASPEGQQNKQKVEESQKQQQQMLIQKEKAMLDAQMKVAGAQEQMVKVEAMNVQLKNQNEQLKAQMTAAKQKADFDISQMAQLLADSKALADTNQRSADLEFKYWAEQQKIDLEYARIAAQKEIAESNDVESGESND